MHLNLLRSYFCGLLTCLFILAVSTCYGQQKLADSLIVVLKKHPWQDTARITLLIKTSEAYINGNQDEGIKYGDEAIALAKQLNQPHALAEAYRTRGRNSYNDIKKAIAFQQLALNGFTRLNDRAGIVKSNTTLAGLYYALADYTTGLQYGRTAVDQSEKLGNKSLIAASLNNLGINYISLGDYTKALDAYLKGLKLVEELHEKPSIAKAYGNIGLVYISLEKYEQAQEYNKKCLALFEELKNPAGIANVLGNIGFIYREQGDYLKGIEITKKTLAINQSINNKKGMANNLMGLGADYHNLKDYGPALDYMDRSIALYDTLGAKDNLAKALGAIAYMYCFAPADILLKHGIDPKQRYAVAVSTEKRSLALAYEVKNVSNEVNQRQGLSMIYEEQGDYKNALYNYRIYTRLQDSIASNKKKQEIDHLAMQYEFDKKEAEIRVENANKEAAIKAANERKQAAIKAEIAKKQAKADIEAARQKVIDHMTMQYDFAKKENRLKTENARKQANADVELVKQKVIKNASITVGVILLLTSLAVLAFYKRRNDARATQKAAEFKVNVAETELKALRSQLNPHFIFNSLNSISDYIARHEKDIADDYLAKFAHLMRMILESSESETISLADDIKVLELYMQLESLRLGNKFLYEISIDKQVDAQNTMVPPMLLQPFVENSIWHGMGPKNGNGNILISVKKQGEMIAYMVEDNGVGRDRAKAFTNTGNGVHKKSFGIKVIQSRIDILNEIKKTHAKVAITDLEEGTMVTITLPLDLEF